MNKVEERIRHILRSCLNIELPEDDVIALAGQIMVAVRNNLKDIVEIDRDILKEWVIDIDKQGRIIEANPVRVKND